MPSGVCPQPGTSVRMGSEVDEYGSISIPKECPDYTIDFSGLRGPNIGVSAINGVHESVCVAQDVPAGQEVHISVSAIPLCKTPEPCGGCDASELLARHTELRAEAAGCPS